MTSFFQVFQRDYGYGSGTFRGATASRHYATKMRWLVGGLLSIIALLGTALFLIYQQIEPHQGTGVEPQPVVTSAPKKASILIARQRIEAGMQLNDGLFDTMEVSSFALPEGAILAGDHSLLIGQYAKEIINAGYPINKSSLSVLNPTSQDLLIPPGYRAIAISIDEVKSVAYSIRPNSRVDVVLDFTYKGQPAVTTVVPTAKVLAIGSDNNPNAQHNGAKTATILVTAEDARKVELSKKLGEISLVLAGESEIPKASGDTSPTVPSQIFDDPAPKVETRVDGRMIVVDKHTGQPVNYVLKSGRWTVEK